MNSSFKQEIFTQEGTLQEIFLPRDKFYLYLYCRVYNYSAI